MRSMNMIQLVGGIAAAGVVAAGATAVTGSGVVWGGSNGGTATQFVGGTLTQSVTGATVTDVVYTPNADPSGTQLSSIAITVTGANNKYLTVTAGGGAFSTTGGGDAFTADAWQCTGNITGGPIYGATPKVQFSSATATVTCVPELTTGHVAQGFYRNLSSLQLAITNS